RVPFSLSEHCCCSPERAWIATMPSTRHRLTIQPDEPRGASMDFYIPEELRALQERTREFIATQVIPLEGRQAAHEHGPSEELRAELVARAREAGLLTPHASVEMGGLGLSHRAKALVFEEAGYSTLGPIALNIHA